MAAKTPQNTIAVVTGSGGNVGSAVIRNLGKYHPDITVRAGFRDMQKSQHIGLLGKNLQPVHLDSTQPETMSKAFSGAHVACIIPPNGPNRMKHASDMLDAAKKCGVRHIVVMYAPVDQMPEKSLMKVEAQQLEVGVPKVLFLTYAVETVQSWSSVHISSSIHVL